MTYASFEQARPVWAKGLQGEMNITLRFSARIGGGTLLRIAGSSDWQAFADGKLIAAGPARAGHGYRRIDEIPLPAGAKTLEILVAGYNITSYYLVNEAAFLCAEILSADQNVLAATGGDGFTAVRAHSRLQKVQRYSGQRTFAEVYDTSLADSAPLETEDAPAGRFITREAPYPEYERTPFAAAIARGTYDRGNPRPANRTRFFKPANVHFPAYRYGFETEELEYILSEEAQMLRTLTREDFAAPAENIRADGGEWITLDLGRELTGFLEIEIESEGGELFVVSDEILADGDVKFARFSVINALRWHLTPGMHTLTLFEPYSLRYLKLFFPSASTLRRAEMIRFEYPAAPLAAAPALDDAELEEIYAAAVSTFRQNTVDVYMDCPSRERAGWLCDSFFTARVEYALTGTTAVEHAFLENFIMAESFPVITEGMLPMCYPADHPKGTFIPNWAMWFVLELEEYIFLRGGERALADAAKPRLYALLDYFRKFENGDGLLEKLESWVFIEWSRSNELVQDISYPSNMIYARMLRAMAHLYGDSALSAKADALTAVIREKSFTGEWFCDNAVYDASGAAHNSGECTESCQYYAFFTGIAAPELYPALWRTLLEEFGPERRRTNAHPEIAFANAFIGNYLRLELLWNAGEHDRVIENIRGYFGFMARRTGTLWENDTPTASCNHGFASHTAIWLREAAERTK